MKVILVLTQHLKNVVYSACGLVSSGLVCVIKGKTKFGIVLVVFLAVTVPLLLIACVIVYEIFSLVTKDSSNSFSFSKEKWRSHESLTRINFIYSVEWIRSKSCRLSLPWE